MKLKIEFDLDDKKAPTLEEVEDEYLQKLLLVTDGNKTRTAERAGIGRTTLYRKLGLRKD